MARFEPNALFFSDGYKVGHKRMLALGTDYLYGTWIPRGLKHAPKGVTKVVSIGQQLVTKWLHDEFMESFFKKDIDVALGFARDMSKYLGQPYNGKHFEALHKLGFLPVTIKALPEGIETVPNIPHMTFVNTVSGFAWLTLYLETIISSLAWKTPTAATTALQYRRNAVEWVTKTDPDQAFLVDYMCHDFSARGLDPFSMYSVGLGHASVHTGSDTMLVIPASRYFYNVLPEDVVIASVNASEHSVSTTKIFTVGEKQMLIDWLIEFPEGILSVVADTFDLWKLLVEYLKDPEVKALIMARKGKLVVRPDSGNPVDIICGINAKYPVFTDGDNLDDWLLDARNNKDEIFFYDGAYYQIGDVDEFLDDLNNLDSYSFENMTADGVNLIEEYTDVDTEAPDFKGVIEILWDEFGGTTNAQGYKVLDSHIGAIYGDAINLEKQVTIYSRLADKGFASTNIVLGIGSYTYQMVTRDTLGYAAKGAWFSCMGEEYNIYKDPITDTGNKKSLKGKCAVFEGEGGVHYVKTECTAEEEAKGLLQVIYSNGVFSNQIDFYELRNRMTALAA